MVLDYGTTAIPADSYQVRRGGTVRVATAFERSVGFVGAMDVSNGSANTDERYTVDNSTEAENLFGEDSELAEQIDLAYQNGVTTVEAVAVPETQTTESFSSTQDGTVSNKPVMNPDLHDYHNIQVQDTGTGDNVTEIISYQTGSNLTSNPPTGSNEMKFNPVTGEWVADSSSSYDITYTYGDYQTALDTLAGDQQRITIALTENESLSGDLDSDLQSNADDFEFGNGLMGANPFADPTSPNTSGYSDGVDTERVSLVASPYGYTDQAETNLTRVHGAVGAELASLALGVSATNNSLTGIEALRTDLAPSGASDLIDEQVMPLIDYPPVTIVKDLTTSTNSAFERVYAMGVIDEVITLSHEISREFIGDQSSAENIRNLRRSLRGMLTTVTSDDPPLLDTAEPRQPWALEVSRDSNNDNLVNVKMGIDVIGVIDDIEVDIRVGDVVQAGVTA